MSSEASSNLDEASNILCKINNFLKQQIKEQQLQSELFAMHDCNDYIFPSAISKKHQANNCSGYLSLKDQSTMISQLNKNGLCEVAMQIDINIKKYCQYNEEEFKKYEKHLQLLEEKLRKHAKTEIQYKFYYEHLEEIVESLQTQKQEVEIKLHQEITQFQKEIQNLKLQLIRNHEESRAETGNFHSLQTHEEKYKKTQGQKPQKNNVVNKIKNKILFMDTGNFDNIILGGYSATNSNLNSKRDSLIKQIDQFAQFQIKKDANSKNNSLNNSFTKHTKNVKKNQNNSSKNHGEKTHRNLGTVSSSNLIKKKKSLAQIKVDADDKVKRQHLQESKSKPKLKRVNKKEEK